MSKGVIGIMGAEPKEVEGIIELFEECHTERFGMREYHRGTINGQEVVVVYSRCGKVAAASTVTALIHHFAIKQLIFTGVAGALHPDLKVGDIVIGQRLVQHDVDVRPFRPQFEIPIIGLTFFESNQELLDLSKSTIDRLVETKTFQSEIGEDVFAHFAINSPNIWVGDIASGDQFIASSQKKEELLNHLPTLLCAEMEGAAVAQVCYEYHLPFTIIRTISDSANESAGIDFPLFLERVASKYSAVIINEVLKNRAKNS